jgi:hypothetical protein
MDMRLISVCAVLVALSARLTAECGVAPPTCDALAGATLVFYGEVLDSAFIPDRVAQNERSTNGRQEVTFNVLQSFKGVEKRVFAGTFNFTPEAVFFKPGARFLVYAYRRNGRLEITCSRTKELSKAAESVILGELTELGRCRQPAGGV